MEDGATARARRGGNQAEAQATCFARFYRARFPSYTQEHRVIPGAGVTLVDAYQDQHAAVIAATAEWRVTQSWTGKVLLRREIAGRWQEGRKPSGSFSLAPPGLAVPVEVLGPYRVRVLAIEAERVEAQLNAACAGARAIEGLVDRLSIVDPLVTQLLDVFWTEAAAADTLSHLLAEGMVSTLTGRLLRIAGYAQATPVARALSPRRLRRVLCLIEARLADNLSLADLAAEAGLSPHHFTRAFRAATGLPPYRYLMRERIARARLLIVTTELSLAQIAFDCGFSSQAHFTTAFTRLTGTTPGRLRKQRAG